jgi:hypothetical protein
MKAKSIARKELAVARKQILPAVLGWARAVEWVVSMVFWEGGGMCLGRGMVGILSEGWWFWGIYGLKMG